MPVEKEYPLQTADGARTLAELFDGRSQLVVYHFMFGPDDEAGCPACSSTADGFNGVLAHLKARDEGDQPMSWLRLHDEYHNQ